MGFMQSYHVGTFGWVHFKMFLRNNTTEKKKFSSLRFQKALLHLTATFEPLNVQIGRCVRAVDNIKRMKKKMAQKLHLHQILGWPSFRSNSVLIDQRVFSQLTPEKRPLPWETYIAHTTLQSANTLQCICFVALISSILY
jgi:hypothetical protein